MTRLTIKTSLTLVFATIGIVAAVFAWMSISALNTVNGATREIAVNWLPSVMAVKDIQTETYSLRIAYLNHLTSLTPMAKARAEQTITEELAKLQDLKTKYQALITTDRERELLQQANAGLDNYNAEGAVMVELSRNGRQDEAIAQLDKMRSELQPTLKLLQEMVTINVEGAHGAVEGSTVTFNKATNQTLVVIAVLAAILIFATVYALQIVAKPIQRITSSMRVLAGGDSAQSIPYGERTDEIGAMASAVEVFRQAAIENARLSADVEFQRKSAEEQRVVLQKQAEEEARRKLLEATSALASGLKSLAQGDLSYQIREQVSVDFVGLRDDFNAAAAQLGQTLATVANAANSIDGGTREIAAGANDLSRRTEQQAASLEETAAALDEITVNVRNSSQRTEEARGVAVLANQNAAKSVEVVANAEDAMRRIEESSEQISNIIGVIDEIAFQTNLLALNAGVEAARAGEAGKGFAVVAQEVRELAQRSAGAAKEIKGLIQNSTAEVESGVKLVRDTGVALKAIGDYVGQINGLMDAIALSAKEQSTGLAEVNIAVNRMDQTTQQNAALVEQSTAASASLASEATRLRDLVGQFKIAGIAAKAAPPAPQATPQPARAPLRETTPVARKPAAAPVSQGNVAMKMDDWTEF